MPLRFAFSGLSGLRFRDVLRAAGLSGVLQAAYGAGALIKKK